MCLCPRSLSRSIGTTVGILWTCTPVHRLAGKLAATSRAQFSSSEPSQCWSEPSREFCRISVTQDPASKDYFWGTTCRLVSAWALMAPHHDLSRMLRHQTGWNKSLPIRPYAVVSRIKRVLQFEHGLVTAGNPTDVLRRPVSQLLAELEPIFCCF